MTEIEIMIIRMFVGFGLVYYIIQIVDTIRWWNGSDENGNPK